VSAQKIFFIFPGQGSQYRGMGADLLTEFDGIAEVFDRASETLGLDMRELCFEDPRDELGLTKFTQPALLTHEFACLEALRSVLGDRLEPMLTAGHSLGEYTALVAAHVIEFEDALRLVAKRGALMSELGRGGMVATTLDLEAAYSLADKHFCGIGGCNLPDQTVIAGEHKDLDDLVADMSENYSGKRAVRLNTEGAFHTYLMVAAANEFRRVLETVEFADPDCPVLSNYTGKLHEAGSDAIRSRLFFQLFNPVRWVTCMTTAFEHGVDTIVEFGGGIGKGDGADSKRPNLESIVKKSLKFADYEAQYLPAINVASIRAAAEALTGG
jgi:[acyl-carrier-protein] S-malonyltransferase